MNYSIAIFHKSEFSKNIIKGILETEGYTINEFSEEILTEDRANENKFPDVVVCDSLLLNSILLKKDMNLKTQDEIPLVIICSQIENEEENQQHELVLTPFSAEDILRAVSAQIRKKLNSNFISPKEKSSTSSGNDGREIFSIQHLSKYTQYKQFEKNEKIYTEGDAHNFVYFISSGKVKISKLNSWGKEFIIEVLKEKDLFGYIAVLNSNNRKESAIVMEDAKIGMIPQKDFLHLLYSNNEISLYMTKYITTKLSFASDKAIELAYDSARKRVANALVYITSIYSNNNQSTDGINISRENISALSGISLETVSRTLTELKQDGYIEVNNRNIKIIQHQKLELLKN